MDEMNRAEALPSDETAERSARLDEAFDVLGRLHSASALAGPA
jgi:hypothetical protein